MAFSLSSWVCTCGVMLRRCVRLALASQGGIPSGVCRVGASSARHERRAREASVATWMLGHAAGLDVLHVRYRFVALNTLEITE
eukprot:8117-Alexandrium_andersonii.AAC.1